MDAISEPGTYRTTAGTLVHCLREPDGTLRLESEGGPGRQGAVEHVVKLSDDPFWPDGARHESDVLLFAD